MGRVACVNSLIRVTSISTPLTEVISESSKGCVNSLIRVTSISTSLPLGDTKKQIKCQFPYSGNFHFYALNKEYGENPYECVNSLIRVTSISTVSA